MFGNEGSTDPTTEFGCVPAFKSGLVVETTVYFCERYAALAVMVRQINWDVL